MEMRTICQNDAHANTPCAITLNSHNRVRNFCGRRWKSAREHVVIGMAKTRFPNRREERRGKRKEGRTVAGRMQLFRRAFTSRICDRHFLYPPFYIPGNVLHPSYPPTIVPLPYNRPPPVASPQRGKGYREDCRRTSTFKVDPRKFREEFFFHIHWGVIIRCNLTNFYPSPSRWEIHPSCYPSFERTFKSSRILALLEPILLRSHFILPPPLAVPPPVTPSEKYGRPPRPPRDRFFPRTIYSFTFYSHRAFDSGGLRNGRTGSLHPLG